MPRPPAPPKRYDLAGLYEKTDKVGDCQIWNAGLTTDGVPKLSREHWGTAYARQFAYCQSGAETRPRCDLRNICGNTLCVKMEHLTYEPDRTTLLEEFMANVNKNGGISTFCPALGECHLWTAAGGADGYGRLYKAKWGENLPHRWIFKLTNPHTFISGVTCNHRCNRGHNGCVNPAHIHQGANGEKHNSANMAQLIAEKRIHGQVFTREEAMVVREEIIAGARTVDLCKKYSCSKQTINDIKFNRTHI